jgi:hypothetical protein
VNNLVICRSSDFLMRRILNCPICKRRRRMSVRDALWYGATVTCCGCGDSWTDGELHPRPFKRGWRKTAVAQAKAEWDAAGPFDRAEYDRWFEEQHGGTVRTDVAA